MGMRVNKRIKIAKGVNVNLSSKGISSSVKVGNTTLNTRGRVTTSIPGTGVSHVSHVGTKNNSSSYTQAECSERKKNPIMTVIAIILCGYLIYELVKWLF